jgi:hypothetical protein
MQRDTLLLGEMIEAAQRIRGLSEDMTADRLAADAELGTVEKWMNMSIGRARWWPASEKASTRIRPR